MKGGWVERRGENGERRVQRRGLYREARRRNGDDGVGERRRM